MTFLIYRSAAIREQLDRKAYRRIRPDLNDVEFRQYRHGLENRYNRYKMASLVLIAAGVILGSVKMVTASSDYVSHSVRRGHLFNDPSDWIIFCIAAALVAAGIVKAALDEAVTKPRLYTLKDEQVARMDRRENLERQLDAALNMERLPDNVIILGEGRPKKN